MSNTNESPPSGRDSKPTTTRTKRASKTNMGGTEALQLPPPHVKYGEVPSGRKLTPSEVAEMIGVSPSTVRAYIQGGDLRAFRVRGKRKLIIYQSDAEKLLVQVEVPQRDTTNDGAA